MSAFTARHEFLRSSPESHFTRVLTVMRRHDGAVSNLTGLVLRRIGAGAGERTIASEAELRDVLGDEFGLHLDPGAHTALWTRAHAAHERWLAAGSP
jgi:arylamine N-acetyltransferase